MCSAGAARVHALGSLGSPELSSLATLGSRYEFWEELRQTPPHPGSHKWKQEISGLHRQALQLQETWMCDVTLLLNFWKTASHLVCVHAC